MQRIYQHTLDSSKALKLYICPNLQGLRRQRETGHQTEIIFEEKKKTSFFLREKSGKLAEILWRTICPSFPSKPLLRSPQKYRKLWLKGGGLSLSLSLSLSFFLSLFPYRPIHSITLSFRLPLPSPTPSFTLELIHFFPSPVIISRAGLQAGGREVKLCLGVWRWKRERYSTYFRRGRDSFSPGYGMIKKPPAGLVGTLIYT